MDVNNILQSVCKKDEKLTEIDKKIHITTYKEKNRHKTQIKGLEDFIKEDDLKTFLKTVKTKFGCNGILSDKLLIFSGDQVNVLKKYIIDNKIAAAEFVR
jgi:translation initiation factor 1 (eIF-1/SUI1)